jgi:hypothetical protein
MYGLVRVDQKILLGGKIIFHDSDGTTYQGTLDAKGDYTINGGKPIPSDTYKVTLSATIRCCRRNTPMSRHRT